MSEPASKTQIKVYVVMPFSKTGDIHTEDYWNEHFTDFIRARIMEVTKDDPVLAAFDWDVGRSSTARGGPLNYEIVWDLFLAHIVIADLTDLNPNVLYELGMWHALNAATGTGRTIMIQDETVFKLPFDFANYSVMKYRRDEAVEKLFLGLVCVRDREICSLSYSQLKDLIDARKAEKGASENQYVILVTAPQNRNLRAYINAPGVKKKILGSSLIINRNSFPNVLFG